MSAELIALSNALALATDRAAASTVAVHTEPRGSSSGVVWRRGVIVTAEHALRRDEDIQLTLSDDRVVADVNVGVESHAPLENRGGQRSGVDRGERADLDIVLDPNAAELRHAAELAPGPRRESEARPP